MRRICRLAVLCAALALAAGGTASAEEETGERQRRPWLFGGRGAQRQDEQAEADQLDALMDEYADEEAEAIADPLKPWNKLWFHFNDKFYFWILKPVSKGYGFLLPKYVRLRIKDFFNNLGFLVRFFNTSLQGKLKGAVTELGRFLVNTTVGILGLWDPATHWCGWKQYREDFDQTLGVWRIGQGVFLTWPIFGPSSIRGTFGLIFDAALNPTTYATGAGGLDTLNNTSLDLNPYESVRESAVDPYSSVRNAYVQNRRKVIAE